MFDTIMYRKIEGFGWYVVGYAAAKQLGVKHYATPSAMCARDHHAPMSTQKTKCIKCLAIEARNKGSVMTKEEAREFWRRKLKLPRVITVKSPRYVYVVENMPYTKLSEAEEMTGVAASVLYGRCDKDSFTDYHKITTNYPQSQHNIYRCGDNEYTSLTAAVEGEGLNSQVIMIRFSSPNFPDWYKHKIR